MTPSGADTLRKSALFSTNFLPYSQTFVYEQLVNHRRYDPEVFCWRRQNTDRFPFRHVHSANFTYLVSRYSPKFVKRFQEQSFAIVHAHFAPGAIYALPYAQSAGIPLVVTFHGYDVPLHWNTRRFRPEYWPFLLYNRDVLEHMTLGLCASSELKELLTHHGVPEAKLRVHRLGIDLTRFKPQPKTGKAPVKLYLVGRFVEKKGIEYALRAFAPYASKEVTFSIIGDGPLRGELERLATSLQIAPYVSFLGVLPSEEVSKHLQSADVLLAPSVIAQDGDRESGLIVAKEAGACAVPVLATHHGGLPEIVDDGVTGFLVPERDADALGEKLGVLLGDSSLRKSMGEAARAKMEREYDVTQRVAELETLYDEAIELF